MSRWSADDILAIPSLSEADAVRLRGESQYYLEADREAIRAEERRIQDYYTAIGSPQLFNPIIFNEWEQIPQDEYRKRNAAIEEVLRRKRGQAVNLRLADAPWEIIYGTIRTGGAITFISDEEHVKGDWLHIGYTVACHEIDSVQSIYVDNELVEWNDALSTCSTSTTGKTGTKWEGKIFVSLRTLGGHSAANSDLVTESMANFPGLWSDSHIQEGHAFIYIKYKYDNELFPDGIPITEFVIKGNNQIYDPRDSSTGYSANAALIIAHHLTNSRYGLGRTWSEVIDETQLGTTADICDESVTRADEATEARYEIHGKLFSDETKRVQLSKLTTSIGDKICFIKGNWRVNAASWPATAGDLELTEDDTLSGLTISKMPGSSSRFNVVTGRYVDATDSYKIKEFPAVKNAFYLAQDGGIQSILDIVLPCCTSYCQAQRLAKIELERVRQGIEVRGTFSLKALAAQPGDVIALTNSTLGWDTKLFEVLQCQLALGGNGQPQFIVAMTLQETAEGIFDWNDGEETQQDLAPDTSLPDPSKIQPPTGLTLESGTDHLYQAADGTIVSRIYASWTAPADPYVKSGGFIDVRIKRSSSSSWNDRTSVPGASTFTYILNVKDEELYDVAIRSRNALGATSEWVISNAHRVVGKTEPPSDVQGLTFTVQGFSIFLSWEDIPDLDLSHYVLKVGGTGWSDATVIDKNIRANSFRWDVQAAGTYTLRIKAVDTSKNESTNETTKTIVIRSPRTPTVTALIDGPEVVLSWDDCTTDFAIKNYALSYGSAPGQTSITSVNAQTWRGRINWSGSRKFYVIATDIAGNSGNAGSVVVEIVSPGRVGGLKASVMDNNVLIDWTEPTIGTLAIDRYVVKKGDAFASSSLVGTVSATFRLATEYLADRYTYWVYAVDTAGNSGEEMSITAVVNQPPDYVLRTDDFFAPHYCKRENILCGINTDRVVALFASANEEFLSIADNSGLSIGNDQSFTLACRFKPTLDSAAQALISKYSADTVAGGEYELGIDGDDKLYFKVVGSTTAVTETAADALTDETWVTALAWYDHDEQKIYLQYTDVSATDAAHTSNINNSDQAFNIGRSLASGGSAYFDGVISFAALWKRTLNATERQRIIDIGGGLDSGYLDAGLLEDCIAAWDLTETSGSREDNVGIYDLAENNSVIGVVNRDDYTRTKNLPENNFYAPVVAGETWQEHFLRTDSATLSLSSLSVSPAAWFKADAGVTADANGRVSAWADQSGNGKDMAQATAGYQPILSRADNKENMLWYSNDLDNTTYWSSSGYAVSCTQNLTDPFGKANTAWTITNTAAGTVRHALFNTTSYRPVLHKNEKYHFSCYVKYIDSPYVWIGLNAAIWCGVIANVQTGVIESISDNASYNITDQAITLDNEWYLVEFDLTLSARSSPTFWIGLDGDTAASYFGTTAEGLQFGLCHPQIRHSSADAEYVESTAGPQYRGINGQRVLTFDGSDDKLARAHDADLDLGKLSDYAMFAVIRSRVLSDNTTNLQLLGNESYQVKGFVWRREGSSNKMYYRTSRAGAASGLYSNSTDLANVIQFTGLVCSSNTVTIYRNGVADGSGVFVPSVDASANALQIGIIGGDMAELILFDAAPTSGDIAILQAYFEAKYKADINDLINDGYTYFLQPTTTDTAYIERVVDLGATLSTTIINLSWNEEAIDSSCTVAAYISTSSDGETFSDYSEATSLFAANLRAVKVKIEIIGADTAGLSKFLSARFRLDVKRTHDDGEIELLSRDYWGTPIDFNQNFLDVERISLLPDETVRAVRFQKDVYGLTVADHDDFSMASRDFTIAGWFMFKSKTGTEEFICKWTGTGNQREYSVCAYVNATGQKVLRLIVSSSGSNSYSCTDTSLGDVPIGEWLFIAAQHDYTNGYIRIKINDLPWTEISHAVNVYNGTGVLAIGLSPSYSNPMQGLARNLAIWHECLDEEELETLYNRGICSYVELTQEDRFANFVSANSEYLSIADNAPLSITGEITVCAWVRFDTLPANDVYVVSKYLTSGNQRSYLLFYSSASGEFRFYVSEDGTSTGATAVSSFSPVADKWCFMVGRYDGTNIKIWCNGMEDSAAYANDIFNSTADFEIGHYDSASTGYIDGMIGRVGVWSRAITDDEILFLYNNRNPVEYENLTEAIKTSMVSYWDLNETSGTRYDSHSSNNLTDNNTVSSDLVDLCDYNANLKAFWALDEASGTRENSVSTRHLTEVGRVGSLVLDLTPGVNFEDIANPTKFYGLLYNNGIRISASAAWQARGFIDSGE